MQETTPKVKTPLFAIYQPVSYNGFEFYVIAIQGDCGNSGTISYQLGRWDGYRFYPVFDGVKEDALIVR